MSKKDLFGKLADSLPGGKKEPLESIPKQGTAKGKKLPSPTTPQKTTKTTSKSRKSQVKSISLYENDLRRIDEIREILSSHIGGNFSNSVIIRIALHESTNNAQKLKQAYKKLLEEDARRK